MTYIEQTVCFYCIFCSYYSFFLLHSYFIGRVDAPLTVVRSSQNPDLRLSRIRLFIWLIFCQISVYSTLFSSKIVFLLFQSLSIAQVTFLIIAICGSLPSCSITHIHQYYEANRLPILPLLLFFWLSKHTPFLFSKIEKV